MKKKQKNTHRCEGFVPGRVHHTCTRNGTFKEEGRWWCKTHAPSEKKRRRDEREAKWDREWDEEQKRWNLLDNRNKLEDKLIDCCYQISNLEKIPPDSIIKKITELVHEHERVILKLDKDYVK